MPSRQLSTKRSNAVGDWFGLYGLWVESYGQLHTDIYGLSTATAVYVTPADVPANPPSMYSPHPLWGFMWLERRTINAEYGHWRITCEYAGFEGEPEAVEVWSSGVSQEPIQTHINFESFGGKPSAPLNGAIFVDFETGEKSTDDTRGVFDKFWTNPPNKWAGVTSYLMPVAIKRITQIAMTPDFISQVGHMDGDMLCTGVTSTRRGRVYQNVTEFRGGGFRGWNTELYT